MLSAGAILTIRHTSFFFISFLSPWDFSPELQLEFNRSKEWQEILNIEDKILNTFQIFPILSCHCWLELDSPHEPRNKIHCSWGRDANVPN